MATRQHLHLNIAEVFSKTPGPRSRAEGEHSAEEFLETILLRRFDEAVACDAILIVDLDGGYGYGTSFLEEAFGGLARLRTVETVRNHIDFKSDEEPYLRDDVFTYIGEALTGSSKRRR
jgi:hypothetical protein